LHARHLGDLQVALEREVQLRRLQLMPLHQPYYQKHHSLQVSALVLDQGVAQPYPPLLRVDQCQGE
jgi:hypothetical protein